MSENSFIADPGFCAKCGSILPVLKSTGGVTCYSCKEFYEAESLVFPKTKYEVHFNSVGMLKKDSKKDKAEAEGPLVERICPKCGNNEMSYATLQLRSADEGQTIFYTCTKCKFKETENS